MDPFPTQTLAKILIIIGAIIILAGIVLLLAGKIPFLGKLPGDISIRGKNSSFYFPVVTCLVVSAILTLILNFIFRK